MNTKRQVKKAQHGQSLVEFAISLTVILLLLTGAVDLGSAFFSYVSLRDAAQEGALYGSARPIIDTNNNGKYDVGEPLNTAAIVNRVRSASSTPVDLSDITNVNVGVFPTDPPCAGGAILVTVSYNYKITMPLIGA